MNEYQEVVDIEKEIFEEKLVRFKDPYFKIKCLSFLRKIRKAMERYINEYDIQGIEFSKTDYMGGYKNENN